MKRPLVHGTVPKETERGALELPIFQSVCEAKSQWGLAGNDSMATPVVATRIEVVHRAPLPLGASRGFSKEFRHAFVHGHANGQGVTVIAVGCDDMIVFAQ